MLLFLPLESISMQWNGVEQIYVPKIGLSDGIVKAMYFGNI
jgi:exopolyphosphatase/guanosine-5'-triphosphate,3'-diphosphate pyrophosphatase